MSPSQTEEQAQAVVLVDTCVLSYITKPTDPRCEIYRKHLEGRTVALSFITIGEIFAGWKKKSVGEKRRAETEERMKVALVLPFNQMVCKQYAEICSLKTATGSDRNMEQNDKWIAACALAYGLPLVTHNIKHFEGIPGLTIISEPDMLPLFSSEDAKGIVI
jgi:toxin FitB